MPAWRVLGAQRFRTPASNAGRTKAVGSGLPGKEARSGCPRQRRPFPERRRQNSESTAAFRMRCPWVASHQQEARQLRWRRPGSNASFRFIDDQTLAVERVSPKRRERGGDRTLVVVDQRQNTLRAGETPSEKLTCRSRLWPIEFALARAIRTELHWFGGDQATDSGKIFERLIRRTLATSVLNI